MRKYRQYIAVLAIAALAVAGCNKLENFGWFAGDAIKFGVSTQGDALTKTAYGTTTTDAGTGKRTHQMIDWQANDVIRIVCDQASTVEEGTSKTADYKTSAGTKTGTESRATLSLNSNNDKGLRWGDQNVEHKFYAVYPSPVTTGKSGDALTVGGSLTGNIPQDQPVTVSGSGPYTASVDMTNQYMVAKRFVKQKDFNNNEVFLYFTPITTAIEFTVTNKMEDNSDLVIGSIELESASHNLSGTFTTSLTGLNETGASYSNYPSVTGSSNLKKTAKVSFGTSGFTLAKDNTLIFTIFLLPESALDDLTFRINKKDGTYIQTALKQVVSGSTTPTFITFGRCKKHFVNGLFVNDGAKWTLAFSSNVDPWGDNTDIDQDLEDPHLGLLPSLIKWEAGESTGLNLEESGFVFTLKNGSSDASHTFSGDMGEMTAKKRVKTIPITSTQGDEDQSWSIKTVNGTTVTGNSITIKNDLENDVLKIEKVAKSTGTGYDLEVTDLRKKVSNGDYAHWTHTAAGNWYKADWSTTNATSSAPMDLSKYDFENDTYSTSNTMHTANCYIVRHAGTYKIPLVYGNAVDGSSTYKPDIATGGSNGLTPFVNHLGNKIFSPYIENNRNSVSTSTSFSSSSRLKAKSASVLWQDVSGVIGDVAVTGHSAGTSQCSSSNCGYITFTVNASNIQQCNAVIAVYDGTGGTGNILWSWHIWITNNPDLSDGPITVNTNYKVLPMPCLGWIDPLFYEENEDITIVLEQDDTEDKLEVVIKQEGTDPEDGTGTYYQWGRKDPFKATNSTLSAATTIANGILNPDKFILTNGDWSTSRYDNLWTGSYSQAPSTAPGQTTGMIKTIYDPSPRGYKVPAPMVFDGIDNGAGSSINLSPVGYVDRSKGYWGNYISGYWSSAAKSTNAFCYAFPLKGSVTTYLTNKNRSEGLAVLPVQE